MYLDLNYVYIGTVIAKVRRRANHNKEVGKPKMSQRWAIGNGNWKWKQSKLDANEC